MNGSFALWVEKAYLKDNLLLSTVKAYQNDRLPMFPALKKALDQMGWRCLKSVSNQSFKDYEVIVTDDSPDSSLKIIINEFAHLMQIRYKKNIVRKGSPDNWNEAISLAQGEYIKILHHDDWFCDQESLANFVQLLDQCPEACLGFCISQHCDEEMKAISTHVPTDSQLKSLRKKPEVLYWGNFIGAPSATIYRKNDLQFDSKLKWVVDIDFYIRALRLGTYAFSPSELICISVNNPDRITEECITNTEILINENLYLFNKLDKKNFAWKDLRHFLYLFSECRVKSKEDLKINNYFGDIPVPAQIVLKLGRLIPIVATVTKSIYYVSSRISKNLK